MASVTTGNNQGLQLFECAYPTNGKDLVLSPNGANQQLLLHSLAAYNNTSSTCDIGLGIRYSPAAWKLYTLGASNTDVTTSIQAGTVVSIFDTTNNHGFLVQCKARFSMFVLDLTQAQGGSPVYAYEYWNGASWATLNLANAPVYTGTGAAYVVFLAPLDWAQGSGGAVPAMASGGGFCVRVRATTAGSQAVNADSLSVTKFLAYRGAIASKQQLQIRFTERPYNCEGGESVGVYFSSADNLNAVDVSFQQSP